MERSFRRTLDSLEEIFGFIGEFFAGQAIDDRHRYAVDLAVEELFTNRVKYNPGVPHDIVIGLTRLDDHPVISLIDPDSKPFDPNGAGVAAVDGPCSRTTLIKRLE